MMDYHTSFIFTKPKINKWPIRILTGKSKEFSHEDSFEYFIKNSQIELLSDSSAFSFVYKCTFQKSPTKSPYFYLNDKNESKDVTMIVIKCLLLNDRIQEDSDDDHYWQYKKIGGQGSKIPTTKSGEDFCKLSKRHFDMKGRFTEEVRMQINISKLGIAALNRNAPVILFSKIYNQYSQSSIVSFIKKHLINEPSNRPFDQLCNELNFKQKIPLEVGIEYNLGIIAMEYIEQKYTLFNNIIKPIIIDDILLRPGCKNIHKYNSMSLSEKSDRLRWAYNTGRYEIMRMAVDTGYTEGDYHTDNLMMDEDSRKSILIDFGKAKKINNLKEIVGAFKQKKCNFRNILRDIFYTTFEDNERGDEFKWFKHIDNKDIEILEYLHQHRTTLVEGRNPISLLEMMNDQTTFTISNIIGAKVE